MRKRFYTAVGYFIGACFILLLLCTSPIWLLIWVLTGYNPFETLSEKMNPGHTKRMAKLKRETEMVQAEIDRLKKEGEEADAIIEELRRLKRSN
jgi:cell division protein FtsB